LNADGARVRAAAARCVAAVMQGRSLKAVLALERMPFEDSRDRGLLEAIAVDTVRHRRRLEFALSQFLEKPLPRNDLLTQSLLLTGLTQLHLLKLSEYAAVSETVEAARLLGIGGRAGLINAVLRRSQREGLSESTDIAIQESNPDWLVASLKADWPDDWSAISRANNQIAPTWLRVNAAQGNRADAATALRENAIEFMLPEFPDSAILLQTAIAPTRLPGWEAGKITVQDQSAQLAAEALSVKPGEVVWDMCAAPGGKSAQLLESRPAVLLLTDSDPARLDKIRELLSRLRLPNDGLAMQALDATQALPEELPQAFDAILLDAPCSATGIIRRQPDVKWHRQAKDIGQLNSLQWRLLKNAWRHLKPGGRLLYSTCSVLKAENERLIDSFLKQNNDARAIDLGDCFGRVSGAGRQRFPGEDDGDGFYYALLQKA
jgi:16S rRNA (cytosine967-C5)-methyltransferase